MASDIQWENFKSLFNSLVHAVKDFKRLEENFKELIKQKKNLDQFISPNYKSEYNPVVCLRGIVSALNKRLLRAILYEQFYQKFAYSLLHSMSGLLCEIQLMLKHPKLDIDALQKYYTALSDLATLEAEIEAKYCDYLSHYTVNGANKHEIILSLSAEVQMLKLLLKEKG